MSDALLDRYAAVERLYSQGQWDQVLQASNALLAELPPEPGDPWRARLLLLQGHTHLYGLAQFEKAAAIYQQVLDGRPEPVLQNVAEQELARCQEALAAAAATSAAATPEQAAITAQSQPTLAAPQAPAPTPLSQEFPFTAQAMGSPPPDQAVSAMPWLEVLGGVDPAAAEMQGGSTSDSAANPFVAAPTAPTETAADSAALPFEVTTTAPDETAPEPEAVVEVEAELNVAVAVDAELEPEAAAAAEAMPQQEEAAEAAFSVDAPSDVIDEPDQVEVRQADRRSAEVIDLESIDTPEPAQAAAPPRWSPAEEAELARGLLTVVLG